MQNIKNINNVEGHHNSISEEQPIADSKQKAYLKAYELEDILNIRSQEMFICLLHLFVQDQECINEVQPMIDEVKSLDQKRMLEYKQICDLDDKLMEGIKANSDSGDKLSNKRDFILKVKMEIYRLLGNNQFITFEDDIKNALKVNLETFRETDEYTAMNKFYKASHDYSNKCYEFFSKLVQKDYISSLRSGPNYKLKYKLIADIQKNLVIDVCNGADKDKIYQMLDIINCESLEKLNAIQRNLVLEKILKNIEKKIEESNKGAAFKKLQKNNKSNKSFIELSIESFMSFLSTIIQWCQEICSKAAAKFTDIISVNKGKPVNQTL